MKPMDDDATTPHRRAWDLIPWFIGGNASDDERKLVEQHAATCADCRDEIAFHRSLQSAMLAQATAPSDPGPALQRLMARIDQDETMPSNARVAGTAAAGPRRGYATRLLACVVMAQAIGLAALAGMLWERPRAADYQTLSHVAAPTRATIRLVPAPELQVGQLRALLARSGMEIVDSSGDGALLGVAPRAGERPGPQEQALAQLRAEPGVLLAEPMPETTPARP